MPLHDWIEVGAPAAGAKQHRDRAQRATALTRWLEALMRFGQVARGLVYAIPGVFALRLALGSHGAGVVGVCWVGTGGIVQLVAAWRGTFERDLDLARRGPIERRWAVQLGRIGIAARGVVFLTIGVVLVGVALHAHPDESPDLAGALLELMRQPFGHALLIAVAVGLMVFGVFSILCVRWGRVRLAWPGERT